MTYENKENISAAAKRLIEIGSIFDDMGITTLELAEQLRDHLQNCTGGKGCIEALLNKDM
jgi:DeoR/GlpR family transcriptional regulator of sugar metabolism